MLYLLIDLTLAWLIDRILGDPHRLPHPVNAIGRLIGFLDRSWHPGPDAGTGKAFWRGLALALVVVLASAGLAFALLAAAALLHPVLFHFCNVYLLYAALAGRCLDVEARKVLKALPAEARGGADVPSPPDLGPARLALSMLVSRDTSLLDQPAIVRATVETVAENTVDGVLAPLFWVGVGYGVCLLAGMAVSPAAVAPATWLPDWAATPLLALAFAPVPAVAALGACLAWAFKAASTLDSRIGYKSDRYLFFGRTGARIDDALNFIPARLSLVLIPLAALLTGRDAAGSLRIGLRDRRKHQSPNSAHPEAAVAGALGIRLGGPAVYHGKLEDKPSLGDDRRPAESADIVRAIRLMHVSALIFLVLLVAGFAAAGLSGMALGPVAGGRS